MAAVPLFPSLVAVIVAEPAATPVTTPLDETVAIPVLELDHVTARPVRTLLFASRVVAVSCAVCPTVTLAVAGVTLTDATGTTETATVAVPLFPSLVAVIVAEPAATPVTTPLVETVAMPVLELVHVTVRPVSTLLFASRVVAVSCTDCPTLTLGVVGATLTDATGIGVTVTVAVPLFPSLVAVIVAEPTATPVTTPLDETVAMPVLELDHVTTRPVSTLLFASRVVAVS
jgi:hypothetical protein